MKTFKGPLFVAMLFGLVLVSCVPARQFQELKEKQKKCEDDRSKLSGRNQQLESENTELQAKLDAMGKDFQELLDDTASVYGSMRKLKQQMQRVDALNKDLMGKQEDLLEGNLAENRKMLEELQAAQEALQQQEDDLRKLERELNNKQNNLENLNTELMKRERRVQELEDIIARQDSAVNALKESIADALLGFRDKGLKVEQRNGKIYVSMEAKLLFPSGSVNIDPEGEKALLELAKAIKNEKDLSILVEGHTDTDKMRGGTYKDNWDLSVSRATAVVRILTSNGLSPDILTAAGRGEFVPLDPGKSAEAKAKNRRIEIILTPNLDEIFEILK